MEREKWRNGHSGDHDQPSDKDNGGRMNDALAGVQHRPHALAGEVVSRIPIDRRPRWWRNMSQAIHSAHERTTPRERITWFVAPLVTLAIFLLVQTGALIFWAGQMSVTVARHERDLDSVSAMKAENAALRSDLNSWKEKYSDLNQFVGLIVVYEAGLREKLAPITNRYGIELPPMPQRPVE